MTLGGKELILGNIICKCAKMEKMKTRHVVNIFIFFLSHDVVSVSDMSLAV